MATPNPFTLRIRWEIKPDEVETFIDNASKLAAQMEKDHPGVAMYHFVMTDDTVCEAVEVYSNDGVFVSHLKNETAKPFLDAVVGACSKIVCHCYGNPSAESREMLAGFGTEYKDGKIGSAYIINKNIDPTSTA